MNSRRVALLFVVASLAALLAACGSSSSTPPPITIAFAAAPNAPPSSLTTGAPGNTAPIAAIVTNGPQNALVNWTVTCGSAQCGSFSSAQIASGVPTTYTAPTSVPSGGTVTVTATSANSSSATVSAKITINASPISVTFTQTPPSSVLIDSSTNLAVTVSNDPQNAGVTWKVTCGVPQCGSFSSTSAFAATYLAPATTSANNSVMITATSVTNPNASASATIAITSNIIVSFSPAPPTSVLIDSSTNITATVASDPNSAGVTWTVTCQTAQCGSFSLTTTTSGQATVYTAPTAVPTGNTITITATSLSDSSKFAQANVTVTSNISLAFDKLFPPTSPLKLGRTEQIAVDISNDPNPNPEVTWSCSPASQCGSFSPNPTATVVPSTYTAPASLPTTNPVTITATSVDDFNKFISAQVTITTPPTTLPAGTYVFQLSGYDDNGPTASQPVPFDVVGAFALNSDGLITGGEEDYVDGAGNVEQAVGLEPDSTIAPTADGNLQIILDTGNSVIGVDGNGLETLNVTLTTASTGVVTWFDAFAAGSGTITIQNSTAAASLPQFGYAFMVSGHDTNLLPVAIGGILNVDDLDGTTGTISGAGSVFDFNDAFVTFPEQDQTFNASSVTGTGTNGAPDSFGRVTFILNPSAASSVPQLGFVGYIIDASAIALVENADSFAGTTGGTALAQGQANTGDFSNTSLSGSTYVAGTQGKDADFFLNFVGALTFGSSPGLSVTGSTTFNDTVIESSGSITGGTYAVDSTGRTTITGLTGTGLNPSHPAASATLQLYLDGNGNALVASMDKNDVTAGPAYVQTTGASFSGNYALAATGATSTFNIWSAVGPITVSSGTITGFTDFNYYGGAQTADLALSGTVTLPTGTITGLNADKPANSDTFEFYIIDATHAFAIETDTTQLGLLYFAPTP